MKIQLLRHATLLVETGGKKILVDPMLSPKDAMDTIPMAANTIRIPMVPLPLSENELDELLLSVDAILVTHTHLDHWDKEAQKRITKDKTLFCQPEDTETIRSQGFKNVIPIGAKYTWADLEMVRTGGQHGTGEIGKMMGTVSGFIIKSGKHTLYIAGDTIWCQEVKDALDAYSPTLVVLNAGAAQFVKGDPITMTAEDIPQVIRHAPKATIVAVHMDTVNHCYLTRAKLRSFVQEQKVAQHCHIPNDGEILSF